MFTDLVEVSDWALRAGDEEAADELLVSQRALQALDQGGSRSSERAASKVKGVPRELETFAVAPKG